MTLLLQLHLENFLLIEKAHLDFKKGLNIITGETGSGKTVIISSLLQIFGEKAHQDLIVKNKKNAVLEAHFSIEHNSLAKALLQTEGIEFDTQEPLIIRKEINSLGKSRFFINDQLTTSSFLKELKEFMIEIISQNSALSLFSKENQRNFLDQFGSLEKEREEILKTYNHYTHLEKQNLSLEKILIDEKEPILTFQKELQRFEKINLKENEEQELAKEHHLLTHTHDLIETISQILNTLNQDSSPIDLLKSIRTNLHSLEKIDPTFSELFKLLNDAILNLDEVTYNLSTYSSKLEPNPERLSQIEDRFVEIEELKKTFGPYHQMQKKIYDLKNKIDEYFATEDQLQLVQDQLKNLKINFDIQLKALTVKRKKVSEVFRQKILENLASLNISSPSLQIEIREKQPSGNGQDEIEYLFSANKETPTSPLKQCASGGELARVFLAIKTLLCGNEKLIIFDEIDASIGGKTATMIGEKLKKISQSQQVLCITHFVQVAKFADLHFKVEKTDSKTIIQALSLAQQSEEFSRMVGI